jgi:hypothetical protein
MALPNRAAAGYFWVAETLARQEHYIQTAEQRQPLTVSKAAAANAQDATMAGWGSPAGVAGLL